MIKAISSNVAQYVTVKTFVEALRKLVISELEPQLLHAGRLLSETPPFPWSRATMEAGKSIFNSSRHVLRIPICPGTDIYHQHSSDRAKRFSKCV
jgi:hypothetical protein